MATRTISSLFAIAGLISMFTGCANASVSNREMAVQGSLCATDREKDLQCSLVFRVQYRRVLLNRGLKTASSGHPMAHLLS